MRKCLMLLFLFEIAWCIASTHPEFLFDIFFPLYIRIMPVPIAHKSSVDLVIYTYLYIVNTKI